jgi:hypothetical protein
MPATMSRASAIDQRVALLPSGPCQRLATSPGQHGGGKAAVGAGQPRFILWRAPAYVIVRKPVAELRRRAS